MISQSRLSVPQASSSFKRLDMYTFTYATPTLITEALHIVTRVQLHTFNNCYSDLMPYTALANSYGVSVYDVYQFQDHAL